MVYDFAAKIKDIKDDKIFSMGLLDENIIEIGERMGRLLEIQFVLPDEPPFKDVLVKTEVSVSSMPRYHDIELQEAIDTFKAYLSEIAHILDGKVSESEAFYTSSKTYGRLY